MEKLLKEKRILFLSPQFHHYHTSIISQLSRWGADVHFISEFIPFRHLRIKVALGLAKNMLEITNAYYYEQVNAALKTGRFDYIFFLKAKEFPEELMAHIKKQNSDATYVMYHWDSIVHNDFRYLMPYFNRVFTFDMVDAQAYHDLQYQPLFYTSTTWNPVVESGLNIDLLIVASYYKDRYEAVSKMKSFCEQNGICFSAHIEYFVSTFIKESLRGNRFDLNIIRFNKIDEQQLTDLMNRSIALFDHIKPGQNGLSIRTIETLAANKKLVTLNPHIVNEPFYDEAYVKVIDMNDIQIDKSFFNKNQVNSRERISHLSIDNWLKKILGLS